MDYYAHTIKITGFDKMDLNRIEDIVKCGFVLSRRRLRQLGDNSLETSENTVLFNGMDYISLCDLTKNHSGYSSYNVYTRMGLSLLFDRSIEVITPNLVDKQLYNYFNVMSQLDVINERYTDFKDEVQVKDRVSLEYLRGMALATSSFFVSNSDDYLKTYVEALKSLLDEYGYNVPIYNLDNWEKIKK